MKRGGQIIYSGELGQHSSKLIEYFELLLLFYLHVGSAEEPGSDETIRRAKVLCFIKDKVKRFFNIKSSEEINTRAIRHWLHHKIIQSHISITCHGDEATGNILING